MTPETISIRYYRYQTPSISDPQIISLNQNTQLAAMQAYAPYSNFKVGAVLEWEDGSYTMGNNQENAAYPSGLCAERVLLFAARANFPNKKIIRMGVTAIVQTGLQISIPLPPCGACRQVMLEIEAQNKGGIELWMFGKNTSICISDFAQLLPIQFDASVLNK